MSKEIDTDLPSRTELRYVASPERFLSRAGGLLRRLHFSDREIVQTAYLNNAEHVVPFGLSIKARRYVKDPATPTLDDGAYFLDIKTGDSDSKRKTRFETTLGEAASLSSKHHPFPGHTLRPYTVVQYAREHYSPIGLESMRITIDRDARYFFFPEGERTAAEIGNEGYARIEVKIGKRDEGFEALLQKILLEIGALPIISKKFTSYGFLKHHHLLQVAGIPLYKEIPGYEIESKLEAPSEGEPENLFPEIKAFLMGMEGFALPTHYQFTVESASINRYYRDNTGMFKALMKGDQARIVVKGSGQEIVRNSRGLECILKREEVKGDRVSLWSDKIASATLISELSRKRRAFWIKNLSSERIYHVSLDLCQSLDGRSLCQVEVEYTGRYAKPDGDCEKNVTEDIAGITASLLDQFPSLKPSQTTKQGWLGV